MLIKRFDIYLILSILILFGTILLIRCRAKKSMGIAMMITTTSIVAFGVYSSL